MKTGLESLDTGAPEITYSGNEGPKSPQQMQEMQQMQMAQLEEEYDAYVDDMIEQGIEPMSMRQFLEQIAAEAQMSSNEEGIGSMMEDSRAMAADGGVMQLVKKNKDGSRPGYRGDYSYGDPSGGGYDPGEGQASSGSGISEGSGGFAPTSEKAQDTGGYKDPTFTGGATSYQDVTVSQEAKEKAAKDKKEAEEKAAKEQTRNFFQKFVDKRKKAYLQKIEKRMYEDDKSLEDYEEEDFAKGFGGNYGKIQGAIKSAEEGTLTQSEFEKFMPGGIYSDKPGPILPAGGGGGGGGQQTQQPATPPTTPPPGGGLPDIPTNFVDLSGTQSYTNPAFENKFFYGTPTITLANGGRANYAGGGIADLRQGYFLGKLVKSITKPFKKVFKGFKKIAKSPMGKMALLALGGYYLGGGMNLGGARMFPGNTGFSMQNLPGASFNQTSGKSKIAENFVLPKFPPKKPILDSGNFLTKSLGFMKDNPLATIYGTSLFSGLYTDYMNNKRKDETMADYQRRLEIERGNFADIPVGPVFAANGGRMGFADGGDDDDDEDFRQKALGALYSMKRPQFSMGGGAGMPPVTMMSEGQDTQSFGDDESTGMPQATPTMQNQMPMRPPMMDPRMQNQMMMAQRGNPMMNRGMMSMQQPRIMAQEGGMMDMGGMEKDYRNEGGFVPIGGQERADDVPARLSKNEFVFTADAVRNAGGGDIDRGAEIMENMMENLEQGGKVSKASQGLSGAREMFATSQRLEEVL